MLTGASKMSKFARYNCPFVENRTENGKNKQEIEIDLKCHVNRHISDDLAGQRTVVCASWLVNC